VVEASELNTRRGRRFCSYWIWSGFCLLLSIRPEGRSSCLFCIWPETGSL